jgi:hypothetical protein
VKISQKERQHDRSDKDKYEISGAYKDRAQAEKKNGCKNDDPLLEIEISFFYLVKCEFHGSQTF